jgi:hypothetical protein
MAEIASLESALARTRRAREHIVDLIARITAIRQEQHNAISWTWDTDPEHLGEPTLVVDRYVPIPGQLGILIGEICYNLRSALDYLIYELAILDSGKIVDGTQFPIEDKPKGFAHRQKRGWLNGLNASHVAAIEALQPYRGCNWTALLRDISNPDKHRHLVFHRGSFTASVFANADRLRFLNIPGEGPFGAGPITSAIHPISGKEVHVQVNLALEISFSDGAPIIEILDELQAQVTQTLQAFEPEFKRAGGDGGAHEPPPS